MRDGVREMDGGLRWRMCMSSLSMVQNGTTVFHLVSRRLRHEKRVDFESVREVDFESMFTHACNLGPKTTVFIWVPDIYGTKRQKLAEQHLL